MEVPAHFVKRPGPPPDVAARTAFDALLGDAVAAGPEKPIDYRLTAPKWQFLCHVADRGTHVLHGSTAGDIATFEPRQSNDMLEFGNRKAVYAAADGLWALFFAVLDRPAHDMAMINSCFRYETGGIGTGEPFYYFAVDEHRLSAGTVYLLPADGFEREPPYVEAGRRIVTAQAASLEAVDPVAKLDVQPADFPLPIRRFDRATTLARIEADPRRFPLGARHLTAITRSRATAVPQPIPDSGAFHAPPARAPAA